MSMDKYYNYYENYMKICLDIDDCVADFRGYCKQQFGTCPDQGQNFDSKIWKLIKENPHVYRDLPIKEGGIELVNWCKTWCKKNKWHLRFLTALPRNNDILWAVWDKTIWCQKHFPGIPMFIGPYSADKWKHCNKGDLLIDDREQNCKDWVKAGGRAYQYDNWPNCKKWLESNFIV